jgi:hypothetical protein
MPPKESVSIKALALSLGIEQILLQRKPNTLIAE